MMCGIAAILLTPQERSKADWHAIRETFTRNLVFNEERGQAASGLAIVSQDGEVALLKRPQPASEFTNEVEYQHLLEGIGPRTTLILGHTRLPTKGSPDNHDNNHPIWVGSVIGVHNGHISNDDALFNRFNLARRGEVDSEIIFRLLDARAPGDLNGSGLPAVGATLQLLEGQFTFLACYLAEAHKLLVLKHHNPLCAHYHAGWNALVFSSRYIFLRKAFGRSLNAEALPHDHLLLYDATRIAECRQEPQAALALS